MERDGLSGPHPHAHFHACSLLYINHSCEPSVRFEVDGPRDTWKAVAERDIEAGEALSFCECLGKRIRA